MKVQFIHSGGETPWRWVLKAGNGAPIAQSCRRYATIEAAATSFHATCQKIKRAAFKLPSGEVATNGMDSKTYAKAMR